MPRGLLNAHIQREGESIGTRGVLRGRKHEQANLGFVKLQTMATTIHKFNDLTMRYSMLSPEIVIVSIIHPTLDSLH